jgi:hypothetical protein
MRTSEICSRGPDGIFAEHKSARLPVAREDTNRRFLACWARGKGSQELRLDSRDEKAAEKPRHPPACHSYRPEAHKRQRARLAFVVGTPPSAADRRDPERLLPCRVDGRNPVGGHYGPAEISDPTFILSTELALFPVPQTTDGAMMRGDPSAILGGEYPRNLGAEEEHLRGVVHPNQ